MLHRIPNKLTGNPKECFMKRRCGFRVCLLAVLVASVIGSPALAQVPSQLASAIAKIDAMSAAELAKDNIGSVTIGVVSGPKLIWSKSYGYADIEKKVPADAETIYRIG